MKAKHRSVPLLSQSIQALLRKAFISASLLKGECLETLGEHCDQMLAGGVLHADISTSVSVRYKHIHGHRN